MGDEVELGAVGLIRHLLQHRERRRLALLEEAAAHEGRQVPGRTLRGRIDQQVAVGDGHGHQPEHLLARIGHRHEQRGTRCVRHPQVRRQHVRRLGGQVESLVRQAGGALVTDGEDRLHGAVPVKALTECAGRVVAGVGQVGAGVVGREQHGGAEPRGRRGRSPGEAVRVVGVRVGTVGAEGHPEAPPGHPRPRGDQHRTLELGQRRRIVLRPEREGTGRDLHPPTEATGAAPVDRVEQREAEEILEARWAAHRSVRSISVMSVNSIPSTLARISSAQACVAGRSELARAASSDGKSTSWR